VSRRGRGDHATPAPAGGVRSHARRPGAKHPAVVDRLLAVTVETPSETKAIEFPDGIPGFPHLRRFALVEIVEDGAFQLVKSRWDEDVVMCVCVPWLLFPAYANELAEDDREAQ